MGLKLNIHTIDGIYERHHWLLVYVKLEIIIDDEIAQPEKWMTLKINRQGLIIIEDTLSYLAQISGDTILWANGKIKSGTHAGMNSTISSNIDEQLISRFKSFIS